jgi:hypothetical protein
VSNRVVEEERSMQDEFRRRDVFSLVGQASRVYAADPLVFIVL